MNYKIKLEDVVQSVYKHGMNRCIGSKETVDNILKDFNIQKEKVDFDLLIDIIRPYKQRWTDLELISKAVWSELRNSSADDEDKPFRLA